MQNRSFGGGGLGGAASADNYYRLLEHYGNLIAGQESQLAKLRQQRQALAAAAEGARQQRDAEAELAAAARARAAALQAERGTKQAELNAIQARSCTAHLSVQERNDSMRSEIQSLRNQLEALRETQYVNKEAFVERYGNWGGSGLSCLRVEAQIRAVLAALEPSGPDWHLVATLSALAQGQEGRNRYAAAGGLSPFPLRNQKTV
ncbi:hypothetical protein VOLCADRAFT_95413 [Volvox carteri f. nagariensis]|uniref:Uncharacterized protein n=1 Tax=Volvox carteri f. nagariensis TaxID=3068 RepID=D8U7D7_VOLCA|nr:uncharacterized protein VOLCADRAFT_95413 [Volvox carteri f. nagariensis]EFJ44467.1 hypothetical protein VOLCADRAFT_95413 [Volvox carteri f. nagariensis]|eukprot:XP_002954574.1 hypothetical protein VOLCADRAFT_95413 [Volvox carteri f. nagariensis]